MEIPAFVMIGVFTVLGLGLMALESFIPGVGAAGIAAVLLTGSGTYMCWKEYGAAIGIAHLVLCIVLSVLVVRRIYRAISTGKLKGIFMQNEEKAVVQTVRQTEKLSEGMNGTAVTALRPSGIGEFHGERIHVASAEGFVDKGSPIRIIRISGGKVTVEKVL